MLVWAAASYMIALLLARKQKLGVTSEVISHSYARLPHPRAQAPTINRKEYLLHVHHVC